MRTLVVDGTVRDMPLLRFLARAYPLLPRWRIREAVQDRDIRVNGRRATGETAVSRGDEILLYLPDACFREEIPVLYRKNGILAVEKPPGLPVDADDLGIAVDTALNRARRIEPSAKLAHRLDTGTGGVLLFSLNAAAEAELWDAFARHRLKKTYRALVRGIPDEPRGTLVCSLIKDAKTARVRTAGSGESGAREAQLEYSLVEPRGDRSLLSIDLKTGRTHQIRVQLAALGHPLLGDDKYGDRAFNRRHPKQKYPALWCCEIALEDGTTIGSQEKFYD
ncbi:MAG: RluA family pseudouridine synthase [Clostridia bacterium]|nr:RluA family pseudouridine synthase [Clostridia bacterium]